MNKYFIALFFSLINSTWNPYQLLACIMPDEEKSEENREPIAYSRVLPSEEKSNLDDLSSSNLPSQNSEDVQNFHSHNRELLTDHHKELLRSKNCNGANFQRVSLVGFDLTNVSFKGTNLMEADLRGVDIIPHNFYCARLQGAQFTNLFEIIKVYPLFGVPGRIHLLKLQEGEVDLLLLKWQDKENIEKLLAQERDAVNLFKLAFILETFGDEKEEARAADLYKEAGLKGLIEAYNNLGWMSENGRGGMKANPKLALEYYSKSKQHSVTRFNIARSYATREDHPQETKQAMLAIGDRYRKGLNKFFPPHPELAFYWFSEAARRGDEMGVYETGLCFLNGFGCKKDPKEAYKLFSKIIENHSSKSDLEKKSTQAYYNAVFKRGGMLEHGLGTIEDLPGALRDYQEAHALGHRKAALYIANFYEDGRAGTKDPIKALNYYRLARADNPNQFTGILAAYNIARLQFSLPADQHDKEEMFECLNYATNNNHPGALFLQGVLLERGRGVDCDVVKARDNFEKAARVGYMPAKIKLRFLNNGNVVSPEVTDAQELTKDLDERIKKVGDYLNKELTYDYRIKWKKIMGLIVGAEICSLTTDFAKAESMVELAKKEQNKDKPRVNLEAIARDPYLADYNFIRDVPDSEVTVDEMELRYKELTTSLSQAEQYTPEMNKSLNATIAVLKIADTNLLKKFIYAWKLWLEETGSVAAIGMHLSQNDTRCEDGLNTYLDDEIYRMENKSDTPMPLGVRLSKMLKAYKHQFLQRHKNPFPGSDEEATETFRLLYERMRLPLSLPGGFSHPYSPYLGGAQDDKFRPEEVMHRFLHGGIIVFKKWSFFKKEEIIPISFQAYDIPLLLKLIRNCIDKPGEEKVLKHVHLQAFIEKDLLLNKYYRQAFMDFEENEYFNPFARSGSGDIYKDSTLLRILQRHGYVLMNQ